MIDLFGDEVILKRTYKKTEAAALAEVLKALRTHPNVAWVERMNSGALRDGRFLGVEVKAPNGKLRPEQQLFIELVNNHGGIAFVAKDCRDVLREIGI